MRRNGLFRVGVLLLSIVAMAVGVLTMAVRAEAAVDDIAVDDCPEIGIGYAADLIDEGDNCCDDPVVLAVDDKECCNDGPVVLAGPLGVDDCENQCLDVVDPDVPPVDDECPPDVTCVIEGDIALLVPEDWPCPPPCVDGFYFLPAQYEIPCNDDPPDDVCVIEGDIAIPVPSGWPCPPPCVNGFYGFPAPWDDIPCPDVECVLANGVVVMLPPGDPCPPPCVDGWLELPGGVIVSCGPCIQGEPGCQPDCYKPDPDGNILIIPIGPDGDPVPPCIPDCYVPVAGGGIQIVPIGPDGEPIPECPCPDADPYDGQLPECDDCYEPDPNGGIIIVPNGPDGKPLPPCVPDCYEPVVGGGIQIVPVDDDGNPIPECPCPDADPYDGELPICDPECPDPGYGPNGELVIVDGCPHPCDETIVAVDMDGNEYQVYPLGCDPDPCAPYVELDAAGEPQVVIPDNCPEPDCPPIIVIDEWGAWQVVVPDDCPDPCAPVIAVDGDGNEYEVLPLGCDPDPCALQVVVGLDGVPIVVVPDNCPEPDCPPIIVIDADGNMYGVVPDDCPPPPNPCDGLIDIAPNVPVIDDECCKWLYYYLNGDIVDLDDVDQVVLANECCKWLYDIDADLVDVNADEFAPWGCCKLIGVIDADLFDIDNQAFFPYHCCKALGVVGLDIVDIAPDDDLVWPNYCCKAIAVNGADIVDVNNAFDQVGWGGWCCKWFYDNVDNVGIDWFDDWKQIFPYHCCKAIVADGVDIVNIDAFDEYGPSYCCKWFGDNGADLGVDWADVWPNGWPGWCCQFVDVIDNLPIDWQDWCQEPPVEPGTVCYSIDHGLGSQSLVKIDVDIPAVVDIDQILPSGQIENIAYNNDTDEIWAYDWQSSPNVMWVLTYDAAGNVISTDQNWSFDDWNGVEANGDDIDAMFWVNDTDDDPANDQLWMVVDAANEATTTPPFGWIVQVDPADGSLISGPTEILLPNNGIGWGVEAATWLPATGQFLISYTDTGSQTQLSMLAELNPLTGVITDISPTLVDVEGMGTDGDETVYITTGEDGPVDNRLWVLNVVNGATGFIIDIEAATGDSDYESVDCDGPADVVPTPQPDLEILKTVVWNDDCPATFADALAVVGNPGLDTIQAPVGTTVTYCINVINHGPGDATQVHVTDDFDPLSPRMFGDLAAGDEVAYDYDHVVGANPETNTAKVVGLDADGLNPQTDSDQAGTVFDGTGPVGPFCAGFQVTINMQLGDDPSVSTANDVILGTNDDDIIEVKNAKAICALDGDDKISVGDGVQVVKTLIYSGLGDDGVRVINGDDAHVWSEGGLDHIEIID